MWFLLNTATTQAWSSQFQPPISRCGTSEILPSAFGRWREYAEPQMPSIQMSLSSRYILLNVVQCCSTVKYKYTVGNVSLHVQAKLVWGTSNGSTKQFEFYQMFRIHNWLIAFFAQWNRFVFREYTKYGKLTVEFGGFSFFFLFLLLCTQVFRPSYACWCVFRKY